MEIVYKKRFLKELAHLPNVYSKAIEEFVFETLPISNSLSEIGKIEKMTGYKDCFKIRFGDYRVGIKKDKKTVIIETVKHRREIYKYFP